jgi:ribosomal subunit interface protein
MEIVVRGRNVEVPDHYRQHVEDKVGQLDRFDGKLKILRVDVELYHERNPRQSANCQRVEITIRGKGPVVRAEACAPDFYAALDLAGQKIDNRMRKAADRRRVHHGRRTPASVRLSDSTAADMSAQDALHHERELAEGPYVTDLDEHLPGRVVREKQHPATPMTVDQALHEMELVGHDFYLFQCAETGQPTVVYRRHAYDYGLIRLTPVAQNGAAPASPAAQPSAAQQPAATREPAHI